jgi:corrinoid protein of di/trimethylamine methyltransferase
LLAGWDYTITSRSQQGFSGAREWEWDAVVEQRVVISAREKRDANAVQLLLVDSHWLIIPLILRAGRQGLMGILESLVQAVQDGEDEDAQALAQQAMAEKLEPLTVVDALTDAIREVGDRFERMEIFLPEMMLAAKAMQKALEPVSPYLEQLKEQRPPKGTVVVGTVEGDIHEIGKSIVALLLEVNGYAVHDLGPDVNALDFIKKAQEVEADVIGASALMTTTMPGQQEIVELLKDMGLRERFIVMVGGTPVTDAWAEEIGADSWAENAMQAVTVLDKVMALRRGNASATL